MDNLVPLNTGGKRIGQKFQLSSTGNKCNYCSSQEHLQYLKNGFNLSLKYF